MRPEKPYQDEARNGIFHSAATGSLKSIVAVLQEQLRNYAVALDKLKHGVCMFDKNHKLILANSSYAELYGLKSQDIRPGMTLRQIAIRRYSVGSHPLMTITCDEYLKWCDWVNLDQQPRVWTAALKDGRTMRIHHEPTPDGGWVSVHEDVTEQMRTEAELTVAYDSLAHALTDAQAHDQQAPWRTSGPEHRAAEAMV